MANIVKELQKASKNHTKDLGKISAVTEVTRLIAQKGAEDMSILREMGMHHSVMAADNKEGARLELINLEKKYGDVYSIDTIRKLALRYKLKFLRSDNYKGDIDPVMLVKIKEFFKESEIEMNDAKLGYRFFILAPQNAFNLIELEKNPPKPKDPVLFYDLDGDGKHFRLIHKWGADLTAWRRFLGYMYKTPTHFWWSNFIPFLLLALVTTGTLYQLQGDKWYTWLTGSVLVVFGFIRTCVFYSELVDSTAKLDRWSQVWNNDVKLRA